VDDLDGGPCVQHTASELPNGNIMIFDNGNWVAEKLCVDPGNPSGPQVARQPTRIVEWSLDPTSGEATKVHDFRVGDRYALFAGSARPLPNGNTMIGWGSYRSAVASELSPTGDLLWDLVAVDRLQDFTYRAVKTVVPDAISPEVTVVSPVDGVRLAVGAPTSVDAGCTDRGGSSLRSCTVPALDTSSPGTRTVTVTGVDGAGNTTSVQRTYVVEAPVVPTPTPTPVPTPAPTPDPVLRPDLQVRLGGGGFAGADEYDARGQRLRTKVGGRARTVVVRAQNDGTVPDRLRILVSVRGDKQSFGVRAGRLDGLRTPVLDQGESWTGRLRLRLRPRGAEGDAVRVTLSARSLTRKGALDTIVVRATAR
jgi:hypothetical protein